MNKSLPFSQNDPYVLLKKRLGRRSLVLVGLMGCGKSSVGKRLALRLGLSFADSDVEIETASGLSIPEIFERYGEANFRSGEVKVISRLLERGQQVVATGGGAFMNPITQENCKKKAITVWLNADLPLLLKRVSRRQDRPLLKDNPEQVLANLIALRYPTYATADLQVVSQDVPHDEMVDVVINELKASFGIESIAYANRFR
jgi:shikimate kinase